MTMQRRHFEFIAETVREARTHFHTGHGWTFEQWAYRLAVLFADRLETTNPNFNRARFLRACGVED